MHHADHQQLPKLASKVHVSKSSSETLTVLANRVAAGDQRGASMWLMDYYPELEVLEEHLPVARSDNQLH